MRSTFILAFVLCSILANAQAWQWAKNSKGAGVEQGMRIGADGYGNCYSLVSAISCSSDTLLSFDGFTGSCFGNYFVKHDSLGQVQWVKEIKAPTSNVQFYDIKTDYAGNSYVLLNDLYSSPITFDTISVQTPSETVFVAKYDAAGHVRWVGTAGNCGGTPTKHQTLGIDAQNNVYIASTEVPGNTLVYDSLILTKLNTNGSFAWRKYVHGTGWYTQSSVTDLSGNTYLVGNLNAGRTANFYGAVLTNTTSYAVLFMTKYNSSGQVQWAKLLNNDAPMFDPYLCMDGNGNFYITGYFQNSGLYIGGYPILNASAPLFNDVYIVKLDNQATVQWARSAGGSANDAALGIAVDGANEVYITGYYSANAVFGGLTLTSDFGGLFVARYDGSGNMLGAAKAGGNYAGINGPSAGTRGSDIATGINHHVYITGFTNANRCAFGTDTVYTSDSLQSQYNVQDAIFAMIRGNRLNNGPVGIQTQVLSAGDVNVYPNPGNGYFKLQTAQACAIEVYNNLGAIVFKGTSNAGISDIDLHDLPDGVYYLRVKNDKGVACLKMIRQ